MISSQRWCTRVWCLAVFLWVSASECSSHPSEEALRDLVTREQPIFNEIREYQQQRAKELERLKRKLENIQREHSEASKDLEAYLGNPLNAFKLIKRLVIDWNRTHAFVENATTTLNFINKWTIDLDFPTESDLHDAIRSLINSGPDADMIYGAHMKWEECYEVAVHLFNMEKFLEALAWFEMTLKKLRAAEIGQFDGVHTDVVEYIAFSQYLLGDVPGAYSTVKKIEDTTAASSSIENTKFYFLLNANSFSFARITEHGKPHVMSV